MAEKKVSLGKVLVIGGAGFLGHHVVNQLVDEYDARVAVIDLRCVRNRRPESDNLAYFEADITDAEKMIEIFSTVKPDVVIHTASPAPQGDDKIAHSLFKKVNVDGTQSVIDACLATGVKALVYTSSASIVSDNQSDLKNADERWPVIRGDAQTEYYSETKAAAEELVLAANRTSSTSSKSPTPLLTCAIRPAGIFGEGDGMVTKNLVNIYRQGRTGVQVGDNNNIFDFTYVGNVAHAHLLAARALLLTAARPESAPPLDHERVDGEAFFVTNDAPIYFWDFARAVWRAAGNDKGIDHVWVLGRDLGWWLGLASEAIFGLLKKPPTFTSQRIVYSTMTRYYNIGKAKRVLGYKPRYTLQEGIERGIGWFLAQEAQTATWITKDFERKEPKSD